MSKVPTIILKDAEILDYEVRPYTNKKGDSVTFKTVLVRYEGKIFKFPCAKDTDFETEKSAGGYVKLELELATWGDSLTPELRAVGTV